MECGDGRLLNERGRSTSRGHKRPVCAKLTVPNQVLVDPLQSMAQRKHATPV